MAKIMIVDDNKEVVETLKIIAKSLDLQCQVAYDGNEFIEKLKNHTPDIVLLDVMMPGQTLMQTLDLVKKSGKKIKIILVTAVRFMNEEREEILNNPLIYDYVIKPFDIVDIEKRIHRVLNKND